MSRTKKRRWIQNATITTAIILCVTLSGCIETTHSNDSQSQSTSTSAATLIMQRDALQTELNATQAQINSDQIILSIWQSRVAYLQDQLNFTSVTRDEIVKRETQEEAQLRTAQSEILSLQSQMSSLENQLSKVNQQLNISLAQNSRLQNQIVNTPTAPPITISGGSITWRYQSLSGQVSSWQWPVSTLEFYAFAHYVEYTTPTNLKLQTSSGSTISVLDPRPFVMPYVFKNVVGSFTAAHTAQEFVQEAFNVKSHFVIYGSSLMDTFGDKPSYQYPMETLSYGAGICGDTTILLASLLIAGNDYAHYGLSVKILIGELDANGNIVQNAQTVNHAFIEIDFADGTKEFVETTGSIFRTYPSVYGWSFDVADDGNYNSPT